MQKIGHWSESSCRIEKYNVDHLLPHFGKLLLTDINADHISRYQAERKKQKASPRTINMEVSTARLRMLKAEGQLDMHSVPTSSSDF